MTLSGLHTFTSYGRGAGSARVRVFDWIDRLASPVTSHSYLGDSSNSISRMARKPLGVIGAEIELRQAAARRRRATLISRQASPFSNGAIERELLKSSDWGVYDFDDALMLPPTAPQSKLWSKQKVWQSSVSAADKVIAGNAFLAERASDLNSNVTLIPSCVAPETYLVKQGFEISDVPKAVWIGSPSTERYLALVSDALLELHRTTGLRLTVVSAGNASLGAIEPMADRRDWTPTSFASDLMDADFGIMPLADTEWERGKCAYKLLQYGATALPMIGSPVGANAQFLADAQGFAPTTPSDWVDAMSELLSESVTRRAIRSASARKTVIEKFSFDAWSFEWRSAVGLSDPRQ